MHQVLLNHVELFDIVFHVHQLIKSISLILIFREIMHILHINFIITMSVCLCILIFACACFVLQPQVNSNNDSTPNDHVTLTDTSEPSNETLEFFGSEMADLQNLLTSIMAGNVL